MSVQYRVIVAKKDERVDGPDDADASDNPVIELRFSATEVLRHKVFAEYTTEELADYHIIVALGEGVAIATEPMRATAALLQAGGIVGVKGLGGFHLACDATNPEAVTKPFSSTLIVALSSSMKAS